MPTMVIERFDAAYAAFRATVDDVGPDLERPTPAGWTAKEMVAHVAFWLECVEPVVDGMFRGRTDISSWTFASGYTPEGEWPDEDTHNAREAAWARTQPAEAVVGRLHAAHERARAVLLTVTDAEAEEHAQYFADAAAHLDEHRAELAERPHPRAPVASDP